MVVGMIADSAVQKVLGYTGDEARLLHMFKAPYSSPLYNCSILRYCFKICNEFALDRKKNILGTTPK